MPALFQQLPTGYYVGGGLYKTREEAEKAAQQFTKQTGYRMYVSPHPSGQGFWVQSGRVADESRARQLAQQWANLGLKYVRPTYTPSTPAQQYQQAIQNVANQIYSYGFVESPQPAPAPPTPQLQQPHTPPPLPSTPQLEALRQNFQTVLGQIINRLNQPFQYDPSSDPVFQVASRAAQRQVMEAMNERGILNSSIAAERAAQAVGELAAQFAQQAFERWQAQQQALQNLLSPLINQMQFEAQLPLQVGELTGVYGGSPTLQARIQNLQAALQARGQDIERELGLRGQDLDLRQAQMQTLVNLMNALINQAQFERSFPLAEAELTGRLYGQPTLPAQQNQIAAVIDLLRLLPFIPRGIGQYVPGPLGQILSQLQNTRLTLGNLLR